MLEVLSLYLGMLVFIEPTLYLDNGHAGSAIPLPEHAGIHRANPLPGQRTCWKCYPFTWACWYSSSQPFNWTTDMLKVLTLYLGMLVVIEPTLYLDNRHAKSAKPLPGHAGSHSASPPAPSLARACWGWPTCLGKTEKDRFTICEEKQRLLWMSSFKLPEL